MFTWVAVLTGSKNALKGAGFFVGAALMSRLGFRGALLAMGAGVATVLVAVNSSVHSYLVLAFADADRVALSVGFYYMASAAGRLSGHPVRGWNPEPDAPRAAERTRIGPGTVSGTKEPVVWGNRRRLLSCQCPLTLASTDRVRSLNCVGVSGVWSW